MSCNSYFAAAFTITRCIQTIVIYVINTSDIESIENLVLNELVTCRACLCDRRICHICKNEILDGVRRACSNSHIIICLNAVNVHISYVRHQECIYVRLYGRNVCYNVVCSAKIDRNVTHCKLNLVERIIMSENNYSCVGIDLIESNDRLSVVYVKGNVAIEIRFNCIHHEIFYGDLNIVNCKISKHVCQLVCILGQCTRNFTQFGGISSQQFNNVYGNRSNLRNTCLFELCSDFFTNLVNVSKIFLANNSCPIHIGLRLIGQRFAANPRVYRLVDHSRQHLNNSIVFAIEKNFNKYSNCYSQGVIGSRLSQIFIQIFLHIRKHLIHCKCAEIALIVTNGNQICLDEIFKLKVIPGHAVKLTVFKEKMLCKELCIQIGATGDRYVVRLTGNCVFTNKCIIDELVNSNVDLSYDLVELCLNSLAQLSQCRLQSSFKSICYVCQNRITDSLQIVETSVNTVLNEDLDSIFKCLEQYSGIDCIQNGVSQLCECVLQQTKDDLCICVILNDINNVENCSLDSCNVITKLNQNFLDIINSSLNLCKLSFKHFDCGFNLINKGGKLCNECCVACCDSCIKLCLERSKLFPECLELCFDLSLYSGFKISDLIFDLIFKCCNRIKDLLENTCGLEIIPRAVCNVGTKLLNKSINAFKCSLDTVGVEINRVQKLPGYSFNNLTKLGRVLNEGCKQLTCHSLCRIAEVRAVSRACISKNVKRIHKSVDSILKHALDLGINVGGGCNCKVIQLYVKLVELCLQCFNCCFISNNSRSRTVLRCVESQELFLCILDLLKKSIKLIGAYNSGIDIFSVLNKESSQSFDRNVKIVGCLGNVHHKSKDCVLTVCINDSHSICRSFSHVLTYSCSENGVDLISQCANSLNECSVFSVKLFNAVYNPKECLVSDISNVLRIVVNDSNCLDDMGLSCDADLSCQSGNVCSVNVQFILQQEHCCPNAAQIFKVTILNCFLSNDKSVFGSRKLLEQLCLNVGIFCINCELANSSLCVLNSCDSSIDITNSQCLVCVGKNLSYCLLVVVLINIVDTLINITALIEFFHDNNYNADLLLKSVTLLIEEHNINIINKNNRIDLALTHNEVINKSCAEFCVLSICIGCPKSFGSESLNDFSNIVEILHKSVEGNAFAFTFGAITDTGKHTAHTTGNDTGATVCLLDLLEFLEGFIYLIENFDLLIGRKSCNRFGYNFCYLIGNYLHSLFGSLFGIGVNNVFHCNLHNLNNLLGSDYGVALCIRNDESLNESFKSANFGIFGCHIAFNKFLVNGEDDVKFLEIGKSLIVDLTEIAKIECKCSYATLPVEDYIIDVINYIVNVYTFKISAVNKHCIVDIVDNCKSLGIGKISLVGKCNIQSFYQCNSVIIIRGRNITMLLKNSTNITDNIYFFSIFHIGIAVKYSRIDVIKQLSSLIVFQYVVTQKRIHFQNN